MVRILVFIVAFSINSQELRADDFWYNESVPTAPLGDIQSPLAFSDASQSSLLSCSTLFVHTGEFQEFIGTSVAWAGDIDQDGFNDYMVGAVIGKSPYGGGVVVYSGIDHSLLYEFQGGAYEDWFGQSVDGGFDIDGDSIPEFLIGAPLSDVAGKDAGSVYLFSGATGDTIFTFHGSQPGGWLGLEVAFAGDVDGDGVSDIITGEPFNDEVDFNSGKFYIFSGRTGDTLLVLHGSGRKQQMGESVCSLGDINHDGHSDVLIEGLHEYVISGKTFDTLFTFINGEAMDVSSAGDVNNDGTLDIIISDRYSQDTLGIAYHRSRAFVFSGVDGSTLYEIQGDPTLSSVTESTGFGQSVAGVGDFDGDGFDDFAVGASSGEPGGSYSGRVFVFSGKNGDTLVALSGEALHDQFGWSLASVPLNNEFGVLPLIVGAWQNDAGGNNSGRVYLYECSDLQTHTPETEEIVIPQGFSLEQNYPNPFNPSTSIRFSIPVRTDVRVKVYNMLGQIVVTLVDQSLGSGTHTVHWDGRTRSGRSVASGTYLLNLETDSFSQSKTMLLLK